MRPHIISIIIARREHIGANHDAPAHLFAEAFGAGVLIERRDIGAGLAPSIAHAVITGQIARCLRRRDNIIRGQCGTGVRQRNVDDFRAGVLQPLRTFTPERVDFAIHAVEPIFPGDADGQAFDRAPDGGFIIGHWRIKTGRVFIVAPGHRTQHDRGVAHGSRQRSRLIERGSERHHAIARAAPVSRLDADNAGEGGRLADGPAGVGRRRRQAQMRGHRRRRAARRSAWRQEAALVARQCRARLRDAPIGRQPRRGDRAINRRLIRRAHGELIHVGFAQHDGAVAPELRRHRRFIGRTKAVENSAAGLRVDALGGVEVLNAERQALQRAAFAFGEPRVAALRHLKRMDRSLGDIRVEGARAFHRAQMRLG